MPYPTRFPYDELDASPDDDRPRLMERLQIIAQQAPERLEKAVEAFNTQLTQHIDRLSCDILLITGVQSPEALPGLAAEIAGRELLPERPAPVRVGLSLTDVSGDPARFYQPVEIDCPAVTDLEAGRGSLYGETPSASLQVLLAEMEFDY
jgi:hypothetical protein